MDKKLGSIVKTVMTRCIHCTRCVRFNQEVVGSGCLGIFSRGMVSEVGNYVSETLSSELSGNVVDLCPVGALGCSLMFAVPNPIPFYSTTK